MNIYFTISLVIGLLLIFLVGYTILDEIKIRKNKQFIVRWHNIQKLCLNPSNWNKVVIESDKLLAEVLKKKHFKGKNVGEKIVSAQRILSNNDAIWSCHKLANQIQEKTVSIQDKKLLIKTISGYHQALVDLMILKAGVKKK